MIVFSPVNKISFKNYKDFIENQFLFEANLLDSNFFNLKIVKKSIFLFKGRFWRDVLICIKPTENFLIAGNVLFITFSKKEKGKVNIWFIGNIFILILSIIGIIQIILISLLVLKFQNTHHLTIGALIDSSYINKLLFAHLLPFFFLYTILYLNLIRKNLVYWRKTIENILNNES